MSLSNQTDGYGAFRLKIDGVAQHGALFYLDAVASVGAEPVLPDRWGVDLCVIGAQKAMGGPAGVSAISVSERAWARMAADPNARAAPTSPSSAEGALDRRRPQGAAAPAQLEMLALEACLERIESAGLETVMARHRDAAPAVRAGVTALGGGLEPYVYEVRDAGPVATTRRTPTGVVASELVARALAADPRCRRRREAGRRPSRWSGSSRARCTAASRRWVPRWPSGGWTWTCQARCGRPSGPSLLREPSAQRVSGSLDGLARACSRSTTNRSPSSSAPTTRIPS